MRYLPARQLLEKADDILGYSLSSVMAGDRGEELNRTVHTQPAVFVHSMALFEALRDRHPLSPSWLPGILSEKYWLYVLPEFSASRDALDVIRVRARGMDEAQPPGACAMAAIIGLAKQDVLRIVDECRGDRVLEAANFNRA